MAIVIVAPSAVLPEALDNIRLVLVELRVALLRRILASHLAIHLVATVLQHDGDHLEWGLPIAAGVVALAALAFFFFKRRKAQA